MAIKTFNHKGLERFYRTGNLSGIQAKHAERLNGILGLLNGATVVEDMNLPGLDLHALHREFAGQWAVKVSGAWRVIFRFADGDAYIVNYLNYH